MAVLAAVTEVIKLEGGQVDNITTYFAALVKNITHLLETNYSSKRQVLCFQTRWTCFSSLRWRRWITTCRCLPLRICCLALSNGEWISTFSNLEQFVTPLFSVLQSAWSCSEKSLLCRFWATPRYTVDSIWERAPGAHPQRESRKMNVSDVLLFAQHLVFVCLFVCFCRFSSA